MLKRFIIAIFLFMSFNVSANSSKDQDTVRLKTAINKWIYDATTEGKSRTVSAEDINKITESILVNAAIKKIDASLLIGLIAVESRFNPLASAPDGSVGLTQVMPKWHQDKIKGRNIFDIGVNIDVGSTVYLMCAQKYSSVVQSLNCYRGTHSKKPSEYTKKILSIAKTVKMYLAMAVVEETKNN